VLTSAALGWAQWQQFYLKYRVLTVRILIEGFVTTTGANVGRVTGFPNPFQAVMPLNTQTWPSQYNAVSVLPAPQSTGGPCRVRIDRTYNMWDLMRVRREEYMGSPLYAAVVNGNPDYQIYYFVAVAGVQSTAACGFHGTVKFSMLTEWFDPSPLTG